MVSNSNLHKAKEAKNDEFYTQLADVTKELIHYKERFKNKTVLCNCNDSVESAFWQYFHLNFVELGLRKLIATSYSRDNFACKMIYTGGSDQDVELADKTVLKGDGDFRSQECIELLKEADIVITNPPFSLFREYVAQLVEYGKKFIIIGNISAFTYKEIFPLLKDNKMWIGPSIHSGDRAFYVPDDYKLEAAGCGIDEKTNRKYIQVKGVRWFTNVDIKQCHKKLLLYKNFTPEEYPKYDNFDAINVNKTAEIPCDYDGIMGVPITFLDKYNPDQFEIIGCSASKQLFGIEGHKPSESFLALVLSGKVRTGGTPSTAKPCYIDSDGFANVGYHRLFVRLRRY